MLEERLIAVRIATRSSDILESKASTFGPFVLLRVRIEGGQDEGVWGWVPLDELPAALRPAKVVAPPVRVAVPEGVA